MKFRSETKPQHPAVGELKTQSHIELQVGGGKGAKLPRDYHSGRRLQKKEERAEEGKLLLESSNAESAPESKKVEGEEGLPERICRRMKKISKGGSLHNQGKKIQCVPER